ncbi:hypothetical protein SO802_020133 [Lithocarpus litseifolius]|uniref:Uncharacterized protein n=1 Tax=Lithocarpus litseifolius TaxID=425828 RepID=A0AAW2CDS3_9ROSI
MGYILDFWLRRAPTQGVSVVRESAWTTNQKSLVRLLAEAFCNLLDARSMGSLYAQTLPDQISLQKSQPPLVPSPTNPRLQGMRHHRPALASASAAHRRRNPADTGPSSWTATREAKKCYNGMA